VTPAELSAALGAVVSAAVDAGELAVPVPATIAVERPKQREHGDYATNVALQLAKPAGMPPRAVAELIAVRLRAVEGVDKVDIAGPGFLNITLAQGSAAELAAVIVAAGAAYGRGTVLAGTTVNMEFISANPTGPLHLGHTRWAAVGDAIARVLEAAGAKVTREFYINDRGVQMDRFGASLMAAAHGRPIPADGYHGDYIAELAKEVVATVPHVLELPEAEQLAEFREQGYALQLADQRRVLDGFRTHFDVWSSERALYDSGAVERGLARLREQGHMYEKDGAVWLRTTDFGDDKDRVLVKADGELTYFTADTAYYVDKRARGFDLCIYLLGADHHGYVNRLRAVAACAGDSDDNISVLIGQLVKIVKGGEEVRLSKRAGTIVTLEDFVDMAGVDAVRYTLNRYPVDSPLTLDIDLITRQTSENPVFYVQYAHARIASLLRNAVELGIDKGDSFDPGLLDHERENDLVLALAQFPGVVSTAAELREPHRVARYLEELAGTYHRFYDACRVLPMGDEEPGDLHRARLWLMEATRTVLSNGLDLLGVSAPDRM
jgi:arginyl-tRNA synthetase